MTRNRRRESRQKFSNTKGYGSLAAVRQASPKGAIVCLRCSRIRTCCGRSFLVATHSILSRRIHTAPKCRSAPARCAGIRCVGPVVGTRPASRCDLARPSRRRACVRARNRKYSADGNFWRHACGLRLRNYNIRKDCGGGRPDDWKCRARCHRFVLPAVRRSCRQNRNSVVAPAHPIGLIGSWRVAPVHPAGARSGVSLNRFLITHVSADDRRHALDLVGCAVGDAFA